MQDQQKPCNYNVILYNTGSEISFYLLFSLFVLRGQKVLMEILDLYLPE
ncbi:protein of unknown function [Moritella yayanosii]|uniref:Uncharacterized protein n=1 Tax=Moritella yayanosii TaxID=69539 RepID=A0A330LLD6_9GAMM|nr:protein of unknown function [Moritella yayanosii]